VFHWLSFELFLEKWKQVLFGIFSKMIFKSGSKYGENATTTLENATRCNLKKFGPILKLNLGGDRFSSQKS
jgi:hypothetical protein